MNPMNYKFKKRLMRINVIVFVSALCASTYAADRPSRESLVASALDEYGKVAGAWFLNERCHYVHGDEKATFKNNVALITVALGQDLGGPRMLFTIQGGAKSAADLPKYRECSGTAKELFNYGYNHSKNWSEQIRKLQKR